MSRTPASDSDVFPDGRVRIHDSFDDARGLLVIGDPLWLPSAFATLRFSMSEPMATGWSWH